MNPQHILILFLAYMFFKTKRLNTLGASRFPCPKATKDLALNTKNRNAAIQSPWIKYGPLNLSDNQYWIDMASFWKTTPQVALNSRCYNCVAFDISPRMLDCIAANQPTKQIEDAEGYLGYCWMHHFKCHSARSCYTWAAGGPITTDKDSDDWQAKAQV